MSLVFIISAPSGSGKSTLVREILARHPKLAFSISYTTREPRGQEKDGDSYHFISRDEFMERLRNDEFLEWAEVFGHFYGTHRSVWDRAQADGGDVLLDIDVQGAQQLRQKIAGTLRRCRAGNSTAAGCGCKRNSELSLLRLRGGERSGG
jgi:guanylate kinase